MTKLVNQALMQALWNMLEVKPLDKITVKDIVIACGINRNTFYYHYADIYALLEDCFRSETEQILNETEAHESFYEYFLRSAAFIFDHKKAVIHICESKSRDIIRQYFEEVAQAFVSRFVHQAVGERPLTQDDLKFITSFYRNALVGTMLHWLQEGLPPYQFDVLRRLSDSFDATIEDMIQTCLSGGEKTKES